ncbi:MAG TPA: PilZ domain-containing protein [Desulfobulbus sp.]|nr:PilZ domain-containing protein [Desulfobulbus sp.]
MDRESERRRNIRLPLGAGVECHVDVGGARYVGPVRDLSMAGLYMLAREKPGQTGACTAKIVFRGLYSDLEIEPLQGTVVRLEEDGFALAFSHFLEWFSLVPLYLKKVHEPL